MIILSIFALSLMAILSTAALTRSTTEIMTARRLTSLAQEFQWSESGVDCAIAKLRNTTDMPTIANACSCNTAQVPAACPVVGASRTVSTSLLPGTPPPQGPLYQIDSQWVSNGHGTLQRVVAQRLLPSSPFQQAAYGVRKDAPTMLGIEAVYGALVDSYNSNLGVYGAATADPAYASVNKSQYDAGTGTCIGCNAEMRTDSTSSTNGWGAAVSIAWNMGAQNSTVLGAASTAAGGLAYVGPLNTLSGPTSQKSATVFADPQIDPPTGTCTALGDVSVAASTSPLPDATSCSKSGSQFTCTGTCYTANSLAVANTGIVLSFPNLATLYVSQAGGSTGNIDVTNAGKLQVGQGTVRGVVLTVSGGATLEGTSVASTSKVDLYVDRFTIDGAGSTLKGASNAPKRMRIYASTATGSMIQNNSTVYGVIYSPNGSIGILHPSSALYGAAICRWCSVDMGQLHFDEAVKATTVLMPWPSWMRADVKVLAQGTNLTVVTSVCGDGVCNGAETSFKCPADCGGGGGKLELQ